MAARPAFCPARSFWMSIAARSALIDAAFATDASEPPLSAAALLTNPSVAAGGAISTSNLSPPSIRFWICGAVLNVIFP